MSFLVGILLWSSLQVFPNHGDNSDSLADMQQVYCLGPSCSGWKLGWRHTPILSHSYFVCGFISFLDQPCHHIYCPSKKTCQTPIYFFPLVLVHCPTPLFVAVVWLSFKLCLSNLPCLVLPLLLDILPFVQFQAPFPRTFFVATGHCWSSAQLLLSVFCQECLCSILN